MSREQNHRKIGTVHEKEAVLFLQKKGYQILETNYYCRYGEIDIVAKDGRYLVFVEVKYRKNARMGNPLEAVTTAKQKKICKTAMWYLCQRGYGETQPCRFDVLGIQDQTVSYVENAFPFAY